jgi:hypothetical protein
VWLFYKVRAESGQPGWTSPLLAVVGLVIGLAQVLLGALALRPDSPAQATSAGLVGLALDQPGMTSLDPPQSVDSHMRGRDHLVGQLTGHYRWRARHAAQVRVLHGMGGAGKTTVALTVAHQLRARGVQVWWISAATSTDLYTGLRQLASRLGGTEAEIQRAWAGLDSAPDLLWRLLGGYPGQWLLVIDNADDTRLLAPAGDPVAAGRGWIRPVSTRRGMLLVTSRDSDLNTWTTAPQPGQPGGWCRLHSVGMLTVLEGARVLIDHAGVRAGTVEDAAALAARLGGLPLALRLAGRYLADAQRFPIPDTAATFADYHAALDAGGVAAVLDHLPGAATETRSRRLIGRTWELSLDLLDDRGLPQTRPLLRMLSLFADAPIPYRILDPAALASSPLFSDLDAAGLLGLTHALAGLGLIDSDHTIPADASRPATLRIHPLIRDTSRYHADQAGQTPACLALAVQLMANAAPDPFVTANWPAWRLLTPHVLYVFDAVATIAGVGQQVVVQAASVALTATRYLAAANAGVGMTAWAETDTIYRACRRILGPEHPATLEAQFDRAERAGDPAATRDQLAALVPVYERVFGPDAPDTLDLRVNLAAGTGQAGDSAAARDQLAALVPVYERVFGPDARETLDLRRNLADQIGYAGDPTTARDQLVALVPVYEKVIGAEDADTLNLRRNLASFTHFAGDPAAARDQLTALLSVYERLYGAEDAGTLHIRRNLASFTHFAGDPAAARDQLTALLPIYERVLGPNYPMTLDVRLFLANATGWAGDPAGARDQYAALLPVYERIIGPDDPDTLRLRVSLAAWTSAAGDPAAARDQLAALVPAYERIFGPDAPDTHQVRADLAAWTAAADDSATTRDRLAGTVDVDP